MIETLKLIKTLELKSIWQEVCLNSLLG